jgi:hypothetical protein
MGFTPLTATATDTDIPYNYTLTKQGALETVWLIIYCLQIFNRISEHNDKLLLEFYDIIIIMSWRPG